MIIFNLLPATPQGFPTAVNNSNVIVGYMYNDAIGGPTRPFRYQAGKVIDLGSLQPGQEAVAYGLNDNGVAVGYSSLSNGSAIHAVKWIDGGPPVDLNLPVGPTNVANDVNANGDICGWMGVAPGPPFFATAFVKYSDGTIIDLGVPPGGLTSNALAINDAGEICGGYAQINSGGSGSITHAFLWTKGSWQDLGTLPGYTHSVAIDINNAQETIGYCQNIGSEYQPAFIWRDGVMTALNDLIPSQSGFIIRQANGMNASGQITGWGIGPTGTVAFLLTPIPAFMGDYNCDQTVNVDDILGVINHWSLAPFGGSPADFNDDGIVDVQDLFIVINNWSR